MGHEFGSDHTFNNNTDGSCGGNAASDFAFEPGSGSTIMCYAGICDPDDIQAHSDPYFSASSLLQIQRYISTDGNVCAVTSPTANKLVSYPSFSASYSIPYLTPFELLAPVAADSVADSVILYCWEENDLGDFGSRLIDTHTSGPIFRSFTPQQNVQRIFPKNSMVLSGTLSDAGIEDNEGEKAPDVARTLNFKCTFRDIIHNYGSFIVPDDEVTITAINTGTGFTVTSQGTSGIMYAGGSTQTITWNVASSAASPFNATTVDIRMSVDGGNTWAYALGTFANTGSATVTIPNPATTSSAVRIKVKGSGNVFFNVNLANITVTHNSGIPTTAGVKQVNALAGSISLYPIPTANVLHVAAPGAGILHAAAFNTVGQAIWQGSINGSTDIQVSGWAKGIYYMHITGSDGDQAVKKFVIE